MKADNGLYGGAYIGLISFIIISLYSLFYCNNSNCTSIGIMLGIIIWLFGCMVGLGFAYDKTRKAHLDVINAQNNDFKQYDKEEILKKNMQNVFNFCIEKAVDRIDKEGNTAKPYIDFTVEHLEKRMLEEINEYHIGDNENELIDIINMACFVYLAKIYQPKTESKSVKIYKGFLKGFLDEH